MTSLKKILQEITSDEFVPQSKQDTKKLSVEQKRKLIEMVGRYNEYGKSIYRDADLIEVAKNMQELCDLAESYALNECGDWFEENTIKRNMAELKKYNEAFSKIAREMKSKQIQLESLYEDSGRVLERYFKINEISK